jgi:hypothetical protein
MVGDKLVKPTYLVYQALALFISQFPIFSNSPVSHKLEASKVSLALAKEVWMAEMRGEAKQ